MDSKIILKNQNWNKQAQVTIFIILAILLVAAIILLFTLYRGPIKTYQDKQSKEPNQNIPQCLTIGVEEAVEKLLDNAGYINSEDIRFSKQFGYNLGEENEIPYKNYTYLCYTPNNYARCIPQEPVIIEHLETEIQNYINEKIKDCFSKLKQELESEGYKVTLNNEMNFSVNLVPGSARTAVNRKMTTEKSGQERKFTEFVSITESPLYDIAVATQKIIEQEAKFCNSDYLLIMRENPEIEINKFQTGDDNKIYTVKHINTGKLWIFAVRGCVLNTPS
ncbi:hypothetical protein J4466_00755 [Candidatus Pacearchaeota archaeon]|nr:hypothetical protein [Candidatus Pacearchaeota archaeon]